MTRVLTELELEYLGILQEECAEVIQIISKIRRFGIYSLNPFEECAPDNHTLLIQELGDVMAVIKILQESGLIDQDKILQHIPVKREKLQKFLNLASIYKDSKNS